MSAGDTRFLCYHYLLLPLPLLSRHYLPKCVRIQFLPPFSSTILYAMFVLFMWTQRKPPWKLFVTEVADITWLIWMSVGLERNTTNQMQISSDLTETVCSTPTVFTQIKDDPAYLYLMAHEIWHLVEAFPTQLTFIRPFIGVCKDVITQIP